MTPAMASERPKKIRALDADDLKVVSALLQDALVPVTDAAFVKAEKRFVLVANRFMWESGGAGEDVPAPSDNDEADRESDGGNDVRFLDGGVAGYQRTNSGLCFDRVERVRYRGIDMASKQQILNLLAVEPGPGYVDLVFSDGAAIRLEVSAISCHLEDLGEPWPTHWRPDHVLDESGDRR